MIFSFFLTAIAIGYLPIVIALIRERNDPNDRARRRMTAAVIAELCLILGAVVSYRLGAASERRFSDAMQCKHNMDAIGLAMLQYSQDWNDTLPPADRWQDAISVPKYFRTSDPAHFFTCPSVVGSGGYAINRAVAGVPLREIDAPSKTVMIFETKNPSRNASGSASNLEDARHSGANVVFCNGATRTKYPASISSLLWNNH